MTALIKESKQKQVTGENVRATHGHALFSFRSFQPSHGMQNGPDPPKKKINKPLTEK